MERIYNVKVYRQGGQWIQLITLVGSLITHEIPMAYWHSSKPKELLKELCEHYTYDELFCGDIINIAVECGRNRYHRMRIHRAAEV